MLEHKDKFNSHEYDEFERMELTCFPVRYAVHELKTYLLKNPMFSHLAGQEPTGQVVEAKACQDILMADTA